MSIKVVAFYEDHWMPPGTDLAQWDHLCRAYNADLQMVRDWSQADVPEDYAVILLDEYGTMGDLATPEDIVAAVAASESGQMPEHLCLVFGRTAQNLIAHIPDHYGSFRITTPGAVSMFGISAASIALFALDQLARGTWNLEP